MNLRDKLIKKIDSFFEVVKKSIDAESELIGICTKEMKAGQLGALKLLVEMQRINSDRIGMLEKLLDETTKKWNKNIGKKYRTNVAQNGNYRSKMLIEKYEKGSKLETEKDLDDISSMFDGLEDEE